MIRHAKLIAFCLCALLITSCSRIPQPAPEPVVDSKDGVARITAGDVELVYTMHNGATINYAGIPISQGTNLWVVTPDWGDRYYGTPDNPKLMANLKIEDYQGGQRMVVDHTMPAPEYDTGFVGREIFTVLPDNSVSLQLEFTFVKEDPAIFEWSVAKLHATPIIGMPYEVTYYDGEEKAGSIPYEAVSNSIDESTLAKDFKTFEFNTRYGPLLVEASENNGLMIMDYRKNRYADKSFPIFWFGSYEGNITPNKPVSKTVAFHFPESAASELDIAEAVQAEPEVKPVSNARLVDESRKAIIPTPKEVEYNETRLPVSNETHIYLGENPSDGVEKAAGFLLKDLKNFYDIEPVVVRGPVPGDAPSGGIYLGEAARFPAPAENCSEEGLSLPDHNEGYSLYLDEDGAYIGANTEKGVFYGVTTLVQLFGVSPQGVFFHGAEIRDWPSLDFRGIHALSGKGAGDEIARAVRDLMARYKMNSFVWECQYIIWDNAPELEHAQYGMKKSEAQKVVDSADENMVELIPLVQSLGHSEWIFENNNNEELSEDPEYFYSYNVSNPDTYKFIYTIYQEAVDFFSPRYFHIGHDEVRMRGRYPYRSADMGSAVDLFLYDTKEHYEWFKERGIDIMIWGDMALHPSEASDAHHAKTLEEAQTIRDGLPKEIIITDWHYDPVDPENYISIPLWKEEGFPVIGAGWYNPVNIANLAKACANNDVWGYLQTTWAGFNFRILGNEEAWFQYWVYPMAGHYSWTGENTPEHELPFDAEELFLDSFFPTKPLLKNKGGYLLDLSTVANRPLDDSEDLDGWLGFGPERDFSLFPTGTRAFGQTTFSTGDKALMLSGRFNPKGSFPEEVTLGTAQVKGSEIRLLMNAAFQAPEETKAGEMVIEFGDGSSASFDIIYGQNLFSPADQRVGGSARVAWQGEMESNELIRIWDVKFDNPHPEKAISSLTLKSMNTTATPIIFGITIVEP